MKKIILPLILTIFMGMAYPSPIKAQCENVEGVALLIIMYHNILNSSKGKFIVSENCFECDIVALLKEGYTPVLPSEIIEYTEGRNNLPEKPIMITFDDGMYNNLYYALPILKKHNIKALINIIGIYTYENS